MPITKHADITIECTAVLSKIGSWTILRIPEAASAQLPSRGQVMVEGRINDVPFQAPLEPDGRWSHWFQPDTALLKSIDAHLGDRVTLSITATKDWPEPTIPADLHKAINADPEVRALWEQITPMARWEWVRWTRSTGKAETRARRITVACSKLKAGERRPCCWNRNLCTEPAVSKNGVLLELSLV